MAKSEVSCSWCGSIAFLENGHINRSRLEGRNIYCGRACSGLARRCGKTKEQKVAEKAEYDKSYREKNRDLLRAQKAEYHKRTYDPEIAKVYRKKRSKQHVEYCRKPAYRAWKREYDRRHRAVKFYGDYAPAFLALQELSKEILTRATRTEIGVQNGKLTKSQNRKRAHSKRAKLEIGAVGHAPIGPHRGDGCGSGRQRSYAGA